MRKTMVKKNILVFVGLFFAVTRLMAADDYSKWPYYKDFTINTSSTGANVASDQYKFPLLIRLTTSDSAIFSKAQSTGADIRFSEVASSGTVGTHFPYQRELWNAANRSAAIWVLVDTLKGNGTSQKIRMFWGQPTAPDSSKSSAVFDIGNGFQGVWHLNEGTGAAVSDATVNAYNGTARGRGNGTNKPADTTGVIGRAKYFNGGSDTGIGKRDTSYYVFLSSVNSKLNFPDSNGTYMVSAWVNSDTLFAIPGRDRSIVNKGNNQYNLQMGSADPTNTPAVPWPNFGYVDVSKSWRATFSQASARTWKYVVAVHTGPNQYTFVDGILTDGAAKFYGAGNTTRFLTDTVAIGALSTTKRNCFKGYIDEVRIENVARSQDWIKLNFASQKNGSTMLTSGAVLETPPSSLTYSALSPSYTVGAGISPNIASVTGIVDSFTIAPNIPAGFFFDKPTGRITGTPATAQAATPYVVTARNMAGSTTVTLSIAVTQSLLPVTNLTYSFNPATYVVGTPIPANTPSSQGGAVASYSISPQPPSGLNFSTSTGILSGTPVSPIAATTYAIIATNTSGSDTVNLSITVKLAPPANLSYSANPATYVVGTPIPANTPSSQGSAVASYSISPQPILIGLTFNTTTGVLSGTPSSIQAATIYTVIATNAGGADTATFKITINPPAPTNLTYILNPAFYMDSTTIVKNSPSSQGGAVASYTISPALPSGLVFDVTTGVISGTPDAVAVARQYIVTASNAGGSAFDTLSITVYAKSNNPITITGRYLSSTKAEITLSNYSTLSDAALPAGVNVVQLWWKKNGFPADTLSPVKLGKSYILSTLKKSSQYTDTLVFTDVFSQTDSAGIASVIIWNDNTRSVFSRGNGTMVFMGDTARPVNNLAISGTYISGNIAEIYLDGLSSVDASKTASVSIWYNATDAGYFTGDFTKTLPIGPVLQAAVNGHYVDRDTNTIFGGETKTIYCQVRLTGTNGLVSVAKAVTFSVGQTRPSNPLILAAQAVSSNSIILNWNRLGAGNDSIRIWFGKNQAVPLTYDPSDILFDKLVVPVTDSAFTVENLNYGTLYYFGAQVFSKGMWSTITQQSSASAATDTITDLIKIKNTAKITNMTFDTATHIIKVSWTVDTTVAGGDQLLLGMSYSLNGYPLDTLLYFPSNANIKTIKTTSGTDTLKLMEKLLFDTTYYAGLWLRRSKGAWSPPVDTSAMDKLRTPLFTWQNVKYGLGNDSDLAFNNNVRIISDSTVDPTSDVLDYVQFPASVLNGFIPVSIGFSFREKNQSPAFYIGVRYDSIPSACQLSEVRMYRYDAVSQSFMLDTNTVFYDAVNQYILVKTRHLEYPFIAMIDTMKPQVHVVPSGTDLESAVASGLDITDSFFIADNISNVKCRLEYAKGGSSYDDGNHVDTVLSSLVNTIHFTVIGDFVSADNGLRANLIVSDGVHIDTTDLSRRVIRAMGSDPVSTDPGNWCPLSVTAYLDSPAVKKALKVFALSGAWHYDPVQFRLYRYTHAGSDPNDTNKYVEYSDAADSLFTFYPGRLEWIKTRQVQHIDFGSAITPSLKQSVALDVSPKTWSDIALPYKFNIRIGDIIDATNAGRQPGDSLQYYFWKFTKNPPPNHPQYTTLPLYLDSSWSQTGTTALANRADSVVAIGAVYNPLSVPVKLIIPPTPTSLSKIKTALGKKKETLNGWSMGISGRTKDGAELNTVYCGFIIGKGPARYYPLPPSFDHITLSVIDEQKRRFAHVLTHGNWDKDGGASFDLALTNTGGSEEEIDLSVATFGNVPGNNFRIAFFNPATGAMTEAGKVNKVAVGEGAYEYRKLVVGNDAYLAKVKMGRAIFRLALVGAYPNPFRRSLRIQYSLPDKNFRRLEFSIVDLSGREIWKAVLKSDALVSGPGVLTWDGRGRDKRPTASGLYVVRMTAIDPNGTSSGVFEKRITFMP
jgi:hypothetical protein